MMTMVLVVPSPIRLRGFWEANTPVRALPIIVFQLWWYLLVCHQSLNQLPLSGFVGCECASEPLIPM